MAQSAGDEHAPAAESEILSEMEFPDPHASGWSNDADIRKSPLGEDWVLPAFPYSSIKYGQVPSSSPTPTQQQGGITLRLCSPSSPLHRFRRLHKLHILASYGVGLLRD
jgi:hypothetical protein